MDFKLEAQLGVGKFARVCGVDEAGRGPLAGPLCVAAVILPLKVELPGLNDSKKLSASKREMLFELIIKQAIAYNIVMIDEKTIDEINILQAAMRGMQKAVLGLLVTPDLVLVDGNRAPELEVETHCVIKGDSRVRCIAAASILAKVTRDKFMISLAVQYPEYSFEKHKGYGTKEHYLALERYGLSPVHRRTFCKKIAAL